MRLFWKATAVRYLLASVIATITDYTISNLLYYAGNASSIVSGMAGAMTGFLVQYILLNWMVFYTKPCMYNFAGHAGSFVIGLVLTGVLMKLLCDVMLIEFLFARAITTIIVFVITFPIRKHFFVSVTGKSKMPHTVK